jgi:hypothetical protein
MMTRTKINVGEKNYIYDDQLRFFLNRDTDDKTKASLNNYVQMWSMYNAINDLYEQDNTVATLRWDHESGEALFTFPKEGVVMDTLKDKGFTIDE